MNIVKGVADLIRRTSSSYGGEYGLGSPSHRFPVPTPKIRFSDVGDEAILSSLWERCQSASDKAEKHKAFHIFLKQFLVIYKKWEPVDSGRSPEVPLPAVPSAESSHLHEVIGCSAAHPAEITVSLIEEITYITAVVAEYVSGTSTSLAIVSEGFPALDALIIMSRSMHNCKVFGYYGGVQKLTALMKAAVVQMKTIAGALSADDSLSSSNVEKAGILQKLLVHVVSIVCSFVNLHLDLHGKAQIVSSSLEGHVPRIVRTSGPSINERDPLFETRLSWHRKAVVSVMEAGGLNWLVELLRVIRRLSLKEQWTDTSLQYLTLRTLRSALADNPRGQNHFRSIGGLEVLLDGLGVPLFNSLRSRNSSSPALGRDEDYLMWVLQLHVLSLEVLREAVFGNLNNLQFLYENGRVHKFANSFCSPALMFQDYKQQRSNVSLKDDSNIPLSDDKDDSTTNVQETGVTESPPFVDTSDSQYWSNYTVSLCTVLSSFLLTLEDIRSRQVELSGRSNLPVSSVYGELSIKWVTKVLLTVFPCIKAFANQNELPSHLRVFIYLLQHYVLLVFRKILLLSPPLLDVFRSEGVWDFIFSEHFFYSGIASTEISEEYLKYSDVIPWNSEPDTRSKSTDNQLPSNETDILQIEVISVVELAATLDASSHNMPECSVLLDALEQSACNPEVVSGLAKSLLRVLQLASEKTISSFKTLDAIPRVLKVVCVQAQESKRPTNDMGNSGQIAASQNSEKSNPPDMARSWYDSMETCMQLFAEYFLVTEEAKTLVLHSSTCIGCLFDLFWEEGLRSSILAYIFDLMKSIPSSEEDQKAKLYLCSKYLETFTHVKDREKSFSKLSIDLLVGMRDMILKDQEYFQNLFRDGECFLHVVSLLNGNLEDEEGEKLVLNVLQTLTYLLSSNDASKAAFRALVGKGYQTMQSLLLDFCQRRPNEGLLNALLDMLVDGKFDLKESPVMRNEDVILLYLSLLQKSSDSLRNQGLNIFLHLLRDSISNRASCVRAGMLSFLLDWFPYEDNDSVVLKIGQLIQVTGGHSVSGKEIRKIFALLRSEKVGTRQQYCSLLLTNISSMLNEKGPTAFFNFDGNDSGITINTPVQWPVSKGFSFSCWLRVESFPTTGTMGFFSFLSENKKGCLAVLAKDSIMYESIYQKRQCVSLPLQLVGKKWHFVVLTHSIGRAFSGGSQLRCYLDGVLVSSEKCSYAKVTESLTSCVVGAKINLLSFEEDTGANAVKESSPFFGQIGPVYLLGDALSTEQVQGIFSLGPNYMYSFLDNEVTFSADNPLPGGVLDARDGLASKIVFGLNAQASNGRQLFNVSPMLDHALDKNSFEATVSNGTQLCSRRLLQEIIYCAGGVSVFFPLFTRIDFFESESQYMEYTLLTPITKERLTAEILELIASVLDENLANQQQMVILSGFSILGFLLQSVPSQQLNMETLSALKRMFNVISNCGLSEVLVKDAISHIFLNPFIWVYTVYKVQRELYMFLIQQFDNDPRLLKSLCRFPRVLDIIHQFYGNNMKLRSAIGNKPLLHPTRDQSLGERPNKEEIRKIRLLLLSLGEMSLRLHITVTDIKSLIAFFETSLDMECVEDILHMIIRALSQKAVRASFVEQVNTVGGCHLFVNLVQREHEPIRLLGLQFLGRLLVGIPSEKKGSKFFNIAVGRSKTLLEDNKRDNLRLQAVFTGMSDRLFRFPQTDVLSATFFDVLLGGASPKQVIQKHSDRQKSNGNNSQFVLPQILVLIFKFLSGCEDVTARIKIIGDLLELLDSNHSNIEALMENGWNAWLESSLMLDVFKNYKVKSQYCGENELIEQNCVRNLFSVVLSHYIQLVKGGWQHLEETVNFLLIQCEEGGYSYRCLLRDIYEDLIKRLLELCSKENILLSQPCRDNTLYLLKLIDEMLISELDNKLPFPACGCDVSPERIELKNDKELVSALYEALQGDHNDHFPRDPEVHMQSVLSEVEEIDESWWSIYDKVWVIISEMNGKGPSRLLPKSALVMGPSLGQRARGLVESLNIPAAEITNVVSGGISNVVTGGISNVVSGGISNALGVKTNKVVDKAMLLRGEKCSRVAFRLVIVYLCKSYLERASRCVQQFIPILPCLLTADDEQSKSRLQLFIWALLAVRSQYGMLDDGARFHVIAHLIREAVDCGKSMLATSIAAKDDVADSSSISKEAGTIQNLIQKDRVLVAVSDEMKYVRTATTERTRQLAELRVRMDENVSADITQRKAFEDEVCSSLNAILASDDSRRASFQLAYDEEQQVTAEKWIHMLRSLIDERGPWSANPFPNSIITRWKLDKTEDRWRRRQKLRQNYHFNEKLCHPPSTIPSNETLIPVTETKSGFAAQIPQQMKQFLLKGIRRITDESSLESFELDADSSGQKASTSEDTSDKQNPEVSKDNSDQKDIVQDRKDHSSTSLESEASEVLLSIPCVLVTPKRKLAGRLAVMKKFLHFFGEFLVEGTGGSSVFKNFQASSNIEPSKVDNSGVQKQKFLKWPINLDLSSEGEASDNINAVLSNLLQKQSENIKRHRRWEICKIKAVHWTRYLLRYTAIEVFFNDSVAPIFLNFASVKDAKEVGNLIVSTRNESVSAKGYRDKTGVISFVDRRVALELAETARESWRRRDITNFEYLMILNTLAGRSYNDLTQYPVFPWVLSDYSSDDLDFNKSSTFRDLSKPVGALDPKRFEVFEDRYRNFSDPDIPSFYYGSHYSSMGIVLFYLLRLEPFTGLHRMLQGGKFDHADRLFQSIESTYRNCLSNTSDVKELVPEFFYMPEFLVNSNFYHFGVKQDGEPLADVGLPPWAKGSPEEFININRDALESEYVSSNLHNWIDLVFGYKQRGKPAVEAANVFYYLTYEGAVDLEKMEDELQRSAIEDQIANFGQTPIQIFRKKHPRRGPPIPIAHPLRFAPTSINLTSIISSALPSAVLYVGISDSNVVLVNQGLSMSVKIWVTTQLQSGGNFTFSSSQDPYFAIGADVLSPRKIGSPFAENIELGAQCFATMQTSSGNFLVSCGNWENSFQLISLSDGRMVQSVRQHKDVVSCVSVTSDGSVLATGSYDTTVMVWEVFRNRAPEKRVRNLSAEFLRKDTIIAETPFHILCGHDDIITCLYASVELDVVISGSKDGTCVFHTLREGTYVRSLQHPSRCPLSKLVVSRHGRIVLYADDDLSLHLYSINGKHLNSSESNGRLNCVELSSCGEFLVCAGDQGQVVVRSMKSLEIVGRYSGVGKIITSLTVTHEECILAGTKDGNLLVYSIENPQLRKTSVARNTKSKASGT